MSDESNIKLIQQYLFAQSLNYIIIIDEDFKVVNVNRVPSGYTINEILHQSVFKQISSDDVQSFKESINAVSIDKLPKSLYLFDTFGRFHKAQIYPIEYQHMLIVFTDVTSRIDLKEDRNLLRRRYEPIISNSPVAYFELDLKAVLEFIEKEIRNSSFDEFIMDDENLYRIYDLTRVRSYNNRYLELFNAYKDSPTRLAKQIYENNPTRKKNYRDAIIRWYNGETPIIYETEILTYNNLNKPVLTTLFQMPGGDKTKVMGSFQDIGEIKQIQNQLIDNQNQLYQSMKMAAIGQMVSHIVHDFKNFLTVFQSGLDQLEFGDTTTKLDVLNNLKSTIHNANELTSKLLMSAKPKDTTKNITNFDFHVARFCTTLRPLLDNNIDLEIDLHAHEAKVGLTERSLEQIIMNLLSNSRDAMPKLTNPK